MTKEILEKALKQNNFSLKKTQISKLLEYIELILEWNSHINLTAHNNQQLIVFKDIIDCMYLNMYIKENIKMYNYAPVIAIHPLAGEAISRDYSGVCFGPLGLAMTDPRNDIKVADLGCGAGFIGIVLSILNQNMKIMMIDSNRKKINFVKEVSRNLKIKKISFENQLVENLGSQYNSYFDLIISRATWKNKEWLKIAPRFTALSGYLIRMAGIEKNDSLQIKVYQGLERRKNFFYTIKPKNFKRHLEIFKKL